jgi:hypothetical protein
MARRTVIGIGLASIPFGESPGAPMITTALLLTLSTQTQANVYLDFEARLNNATTLSGKITTTVTTSSGTAVSSETFKFKRPNLARVESWQNGHRYELTVSDGKDCWFYDLIQNRVGRQDSDPVGFLNRITALDAFLDPKHSATAEAHGRAAREPSELSRKAGARVQTARRPSRPLTTTG